MGFGRFHAQMVVTVSQEESEGARPVRDLTARCRLATAVNKEAVLANVKKDGAIVYRKLTRADKKEDEEET